jgi:NAD-dependent deacetylase
MEVLFMKNETQLNARRCADMIDRSEKCVLLSGAGMSTNAGIPDFRGPNGIYRREMQTNPELIFDIDHFIEQPEFFYSFHRNFLQELGKVDPTFAHYFFADLEKKGKMLGIVTQNIDALHQKAGSEKVYEIHGSTWKSHCISCHREYDYYSSFEKTMREDVPKCEECGGVIKPDIVFFGENVKYLYECRNIVSNADLLIIAGSSLVVTPAALLPSMCRGEIVIVNRGEISYSYLSENKISLIVEEDIDNFFSEVNRYLKYI